jgi:hypothetical protein
VKLAEALASRADAQKRLAQLRNRIAMSARYQEGDAPSEDAGELLAEADRIADDLERLIRAINKTNSLTEVEPGISLTDALARRDVLAVRRSMVQSAADAGSIRQDRSTRSEVKFVTSLDVPELRRRADDLAREYRELDARVQALNWETELIETE